MLCGHHKLPTVYEKLHKHTDALNCMVPGFYLSQAVDVCLSVAISNLFCQRPKGNNTFRTGNNLCFSNPPAVKPILL